MKIRITTGIENTLKVESFTCVRNDMFLAVAREFLDVVSGKVSMSCSLDDGIKTMKVIEAIRESSRTGKTVDL